MKADLAADKVVFKCPGVVVLCLAKDGAFAGDAGNECSA